MGNAKKHRAIFKPSVLPPATQLTAAQHLRANQSKIISLWKLRAYQRIPKLKGADSADLDHSLLEFLNCLAQALSSPSLEEITQHKECCNLLEQGSELNHLSDYQIDELALKYHILRQVIFEVLREEGGLTDRDADIILQIIETGQRSALSQFLQYRQGELARKTRDYESVFNAIPDPVVLADKNRKIITCNHAVEKFFGYTPNELIGKETSMLYAFPIDFQHTGKYRYNIRTGLTGPSSYSIQYRRKNGEIFISETHSTVLRDEYGQVVGYLAIMRDVTDQERSKEDLRKSEGIQRQLAEARNELLFLEQSLYKEAEAARLELYEFIMQAPVALCVLMGPEHKITIANPMYLKITDRNPIGMTAREAFREEEVGRFFQQLDEVYWTGSPQLEKEVFFPRRNEQGAITEIYLNVGYHPFRESDGTIKGVLAIVQDVTELVHARKNIEKAAKQVAAEKRKFEAIFFSSPVSMALLRGPDLEFEIVNPSFQNMIGNQNFVGKKLQNVIPEYINFPFIEYMKQVYETGVPHQGHEVGVRFAGGPDGTPVERYYDYLYTRVNDEEGRPYGVFNHVLDVTEKVLARKYVEESELRFRQLADAMPQIVWTADQAGNIDYFNQRFYDYTGLTPDTSMGWGWKKVVHPDDFARVLPIWEESIRTGKHFFVECRIQQKEGPYRWQLGRAVPITNDTGQIIKWFGTNTDFHDYKLALEHLVEERDIRERFVATLTHDLRTPLTAAKMSAEMLVLKANDPNVISRAAVNILNNIDRIDHMIRDLLDGSRIRAGESLPIKPVQCDLKEVVQKTVANLSSIYGDRFVIESPSRVEAYLDRRGLQRILENLCNNSVKYGSSQDPITIRIQDRMNEVEISVHNCGNPISADDQRSLFEPYRRTESAQKGSQIGWGLGLTLVRGLTEAHGGRVQVKSNIEAGTTFSVFLPKAGPR